MFLPVFILLVLFAFYGGLIAWYHRAWNAIPVFLPDLPVTMEDSGGRHKEEGPKISVLVPARNEEANISACLQSLSQQTYPKNLFQVIVIDDHSTDRTWEVLHSFDPGGMQVSGIRMAEQAGAGEPVKAHKKFAIETGIGKATGDLIVTTDADCWFHPDWLRTIAGFYTRAKARFIAAPVRIEGSRSFLSIFQILDFITLQGITGAAVHKRFHSMCNGANLAYERKTFYEVNGFKGIDSIPSGDDMLLMHKIYRKYPDEVFFLKHPHAIVSTHAETKWKGFFNQRIRWASKADQYDDKRIFWVLLLVYVINFLFMGLLVASVWNRWYLLIFLVLLLVKTLIEYPFVRAVAAFFRQQRLMAYFPLLQPFHIFYTITVGWLGKFGSYHWKERKITK